MDKGKKILIIKCGALGDVLRTTPLLWALKGSRIYWVTDKEALPLIPGGSYGCKPLDIACAREALEGMSFDMVLSLDECPQAGMLAREVRTGELRGVFMGTEGRLEYTASSASWFDMSLISRLGKDRADEIKRNNRRSFQDHIFSMAGVRFDNQPYIFPLAEKRKPAARNRFKVGLEARAGKRWPSKQWSHYGDLAEALRSDGMEIQLFTVKQDIASYAGEIASCDLVVTGDTFCLHIAIALAIPCVCLFTCTSPYEIEGYGLVDKIISPGLEKAFYQTTYIEEAVEGISVEEVYRAVRHALPGTRGFLHG